MKVILVGVNSKFVHSNLAIRYLKAYTEDLNYTCKNMEFSINDRVERVVEELLQEKPNFIGFSCYIWNIDFIIQLANLIKLVNPDIEIAYGGPEVTYNPKEFLSTNVGEYVIEGEGEESYRELIINKLKEINNGEIIESITGIYIKRKNNISYGGKRSLMDMNNIIFPYDEAENLDNKIVYYEGSRGCPFNCKYCLSSTIHGVRFLDINRVRKELKFFIEKGVSLVKFVDRTFNCNKVFANAIWEFLIAEGGETIFHFEISADLLSIESIEILKRAPKDMFQFEIGVQSTNEEVLKSINRTIKFSDISKKVRELNELNNIKQHLDLIAGLPGENYESFKKSFNDVYKIEPEELQLGFLKLLKGSQMRDESDKWGIVYSPYPPYEVLKTKDITYDELIRLKKVEHMVDKYLNSGKFNNIIKFFLCSNVFAEPFDFYYELSRFFEWKGYFARNISSNTYYELFMEFNKEVVKGNELVLRDIIKYDYLCFNNKRGIPEFMKENMDKSMEKNIKSKLQEEKYIDNTSQVAIFKFMIDMQEFINNKNVVNCENFILFDKEHINKKMFLKSIINN